MLPLKDRSSPVTPATPEAPCWAASSVMRVERCGAAFVDRLGDLRHLAAQDVVSPAPSEPRKPIELTLLPTTSSPAEYCFSAKQ